MFYCDIFPEMFTIFLKPTFLGSTRNKTYAIIIFKKAENVHCKSNCYRS